MTPEILKARTQDFALRVIRLVDALPNNPVGRNISSQLMRAATSVGANYRAACRGRSTAEFVAKLGIVEEEADESCYWMELIIRSELLAESRVRPLLDEANELVAIIVTSKKTARQTNRQSKIQDRKSTNG